MKKGVNILTLKHGLIAVLFLGGDIFAQADLGAPELAQVQTSVIQTEANGLYASGKYAQALPYIEELIHRVEGSKDDGVRAQLERLYFSKGVAAMAAEQPDQAIEGFKNYTEKFPNGSDIRTGMDMLGDSYAMAESYEEAAKTWIKLRQSIKLKPAENTAVLAKICDAYTAAKDWEAAIPLLKELLTIAQDNETRGKAAVALSQASIESGQPELIIEMLPYLGMKNNGARYDLDFNLTLIRGGDSVPSEEKTGLALVLYGLVLDKAQLLKWQEQEIKRLTALRDEMIARRQLGPGIAQMNEQIRKANAQKKKLEETEAYSEELRLRMARSYFQSGRKWEALWTFWSIYKDFPNTEYSEQALYAAFGLAAELGLTDRAIDLGKIYIENFPKGAQFADVTIGVGQLQVQKKGLQGLPDVVSTSF